MMEAVFLHIVNSAVSAGWLVLAILVLRPLLKRAPRSLFPILWGMVAVRLLLPFSIQSVLSLLPSAQVLPQGIAHTATPQIHTGLSSIDTAVNPVLPPAVGASMNPWQLVLALAWCVWLAGVGAMLLYFFLSTLRVRRSVREAVPDSKNVYLCDRISTPFLFGIVHPRIYLPSDTPNEARDYILAHENVHLQRGDHIWKPLGFLLLSVYWFQPLMWVSYWLLCRDLEAVCDERVIRGLTGDGRANYSQALLRCAARERVRVCPVAFGEGNVKGRVKRVLRYKKPAVWVVALSVAACAALAVCFLTDPKEAPPAAVPAPTVEVTPPPVELPPEPSEPPEPPKEELPRQLVKLNGYLYENTGEESSLTVRCGTPDLWIGASVAENETPTHDGESNFGTGFEGQYTTAGEEVEICMADGRWYVFRAVEPYFSEYVCRSESPEYLPPKLYLRNGYFEFQLSLFSSQKLFGRYTLTEDSLSMTTYDKANIFVFDREEDQFRFRADLSTPLIAYCYASGADPQPPIEDGAVFSPASTEE